MRALVITNSITRRDSRSIEKYLNEIAKYDVLTPEEELELFKKFRNGDERAFSKIIRSNLRFVVSVAKQYQHVGLTLNDLINEGNMGLIKAARRFDETKGFKFISYAVWWIRQTILQAINDKARKIRVPQNQQTTSSKIIKMRDELMKDLEREPSLEELAEGMEMEESDIEKSLQSYQLCRSLNAPMDSEEDFTLENVLEDEKIDSPDNKMVHKESLRIEALEMLKTLSPREAEILSLFFGINRKRAHSLNDIADYFDLSRERVRQIKDRALLKLRRRMRRGSVN
jgi:RNA polymerase primary sigma factor